MKNQLYLTEIKYHNNKVKSCYQRYHACVTWTRTSDLSRSVIEIRRKRLSPADAAIISQRVAISRGPRVPRASRRFSRCCSLFANTLTKGTGRSRRLPLAITPMSRPSEAARTDSRLRCCQAETTNRRHFLLPRRHGQTTRSARLPCYLVHVGGGTATGGRGSTGVCVNQGSKYNQPRRYEEWDARIANAQ